MELQSKTNKELRDILTELGLEFDKKDTKADLIKIIEGNSVSKEISKIYTDKLSVEDVVEDVSCGKKVIAEYFSKGVWKRMVEEFESEELANRGLDKIGAHKRRFI